MDPTAPDPATSTDSDARLRPLFDAVCDADRRSARPRDLIAALTAAGLRPDDPRLGGVARRVRDLPRPDEPQLDLARFADVTRDGLALVERAIRRELVIPDFEGFGAEVEEIFAAARTERGGNVATYIPQLARVDPELYALGLCTIDGQRLALGDAEERFCVQSTCKPINYCIALEDEGAATVHRHIGREPSGKTFNELSLNDEGLPHNPMINAGGIMSCALIGRRLGTADRFDHVMRTWQRLTGGSRPGFDNAVYLSERKTADRNFALGYFMREHRAFPDGTDLTETLEFYFQCCSIEIDVDRFALVAATLANGGIHPLTEERVLAPDTVQNCLSLMYSCGMYDFSGEWAFTVGLPAKSGVSGVILVVIPNTLGFAIWSPRLDEHGNSVRGIAFCTELIRRFRFHHYDNLMGDRDDKRDPRRPPRFDERARVAELHWAAAEGDLQALRRIAARGTDLNAVDYEGRTALHVAAAAGRNAIVRFLLDHGAEPTATDRFGRRAVADREP